MIERQKAKKHEIIISSSFLKSVTTWLKANRIHKEIELLLQAWHMFSVHTTLTVFSGDLWTRLLSIQMHSTRKPAAASFFAHCSELPKELTKSTFLRSLCSSQQSRSKGTGTTPIV